MAQFVKNGLGYKRIFSKSELDNFKMRNEASSIVAENDNLKARVSALESVVQQLLDNTDLGITLSSDNNTEEESSNE